MSTPAGDAVWIPVLPSMQDFAPTLAKGAGQAADREGKKVGGRFGKALAGGTALALGGGAAATRYLYQVGAAFDEMRDTIRVGTGAVGADLDKLTDSAKAVSMNVPDGFDQVGTAVADLNTRLGATGPHLEQLSRQMLDVSRLTNTDLSANIKTATRLFGDWGVETDKQSETLDRLYRAAQSTGAGFDKLASDATKYGAPMRQMGFSLDETLALLGKFEKEGVNTELVMGSMRKALGKLAKEGKNPVEAFRDTSQAIKDAGSAGEANTIALELFGAKAGPDMAAAIREGRFEIDDLVGAISDGSDTITSAADDTADFAEQWAIFKNRAMVQLEPIATRVFNAFGSGMQWMNDTGMPTLERWGKQWQEGSGSLGVAKSVLTAVGGVLKSVGGFLVDHKKLVASAVAAYAGYRTVRATMTAVKAVTLAVRGAKLGYAAATYGAAGASMAQTRAEKMGLFIGRAKLVVTKAQTIAQKALTVATRIFNKVFMQSPIGRIVFLVGLLVAAFVIAYKKSETFRKIVDGAIQGVKDVAARVFGWFKDTAWPWMKSVFDGIGAAAMWLWNKAIKPYFSFIFGIWKRVFGFLAKTAWPVAKNIFAKLGAVVSWLWRKVVRPYFGFIFGIWKSIFGFLAKTAWPVARRVFQWIGDKAKWLWNNAAKPAFDGLKKGLDAVVGGFRAAKRGIGRAWSTLKDVISKPVNAVLGWIDENFIGPVNRMLSKVDIDWKLPSVGGGGGPTRQEGPMRPRVGGRADGGMIPGPWRGPRADNIMGVDGRGMPTVRVNPGEFVTRVAATRRMQRKHPGALEHINRYGTIPGLAGGGMVYQQMASWLRKNIPGAAITSDYRPGAITATGNQSYHAQGKALDIAPSMDTFTKIRLAFGHRIAELIYSPAGRHQIKNGAPHMYGEPVRGMHWDHVHWAMQSMTGGGGSLFGGLAGRVLDKGKSALNAILNKIPMKGMWAQTAVSAARKTLDTIVDKVQGAVGGGDATSIPVGGGAAPGSGVERWRPLVLRALRIMGLGDQFANSTLRRMQQESGGNPRAINLWDSNARAGMPSRGLMQVIPPTFARYRHPEYSADIYDPLANVLASMRYAIARYGNLWAAYDRPGGYAAGTRSARPGPAWVGEEGPELMWMRGGERIMSHRDSMRAARPVVTKAALLDDRPLYLTVVDRDGTLIDRMRAEIDQTQAHAARVGRNSGL